MFYKQNTLNFLSEDKTRSSKRILNSCIFGTLNTNDKGIWVKPAWRDIQFGIWKVDFR